MKSRNKAFINFFAFTVILIGIWYMTIFHNYSYGVDSYNLNDLSEILSYK